MEWLISILGLALIGSPFAFGYSTNSTALWTSIILGAVVALVAGYKAVTRDETKWEDWVDVVAGLLVLIAPFVLGFSTLVTALWVSIVLGALLIILSGYQLFVPPQRTPA